MQRVAIVGGVRTPFVKAGTKFRAYSFQQLGVHVTKALVKRYELKPEAVDEFIFSTVLVDPTTPNWAREIWFAAGLPESVYAYSVSNNCISGLVAITTGALRISAGHSHCAIAGGSESMSNPSLLFNKKATRLFLELFRARSLAERVKLMTRFRPGYFLPAPPGIAEPSTGLSMGQHMEITAKEFHISRSDQDLIAYNSHQRGAAATKSGRLQKEIEPLDGVANDLLIRQDTSLEKLAKLPPVFDPSPAGTISAGNSSALTDGASAVLLMSEERAKKEGREILAFLRGYEFGAISPKDGLLMAPGVVVPRLLARENLTLNDFDLVEIHEAFGAQVVANLKVWKEGWKERAIGEVSYDRLNVFGGSIAIGHPFAATGGRIVSTLAHELRNQKLKRGLISICAAGAMAGAMILERE